MGPNAVYPLATLRRLLLIADLKQRRLPPTGRRLSLEEIRHELDFTEIESLASVAHPAPPACHELLDSLVSDEPQLSSIREMVSFPPEGQIPGPNPSIKLLLADFADLLSEISTNHNLTTTTNSNQWKRLSTPDIEINVRQPDGPAARARLAELARSLLQILNSNHEPNSENLEVDHDPDPS